MIALAESKGLKIEVLDASRLPKQRRESTQMWARRVRHTWFESFANRGFQVVVAHNANDLLENTLLRLARGTTPKNLAGMSQLDGHLWRPLLRIDRKTIEKAMRASRKAWREDVTNTQKLYARTEFGTTSSLFWMNFTRELLNAPPGTCLQETVVKMLGFNLRKIFP